MKWIKYIGHPVFVMSLYLLLLIESEHFGGFYILYVLMALPAGALFSVLAVVGLMILFIGYKIYRQNVHPLKPIMYLLGFVIMIVSLLIFFSKKDRLETFSLALPTITFVLFGICSINFLINAFSLLITSSFGRGIRLN